MMYQTPNKEQSNSPRVSICIPYYNVPDLMQLCLGAIRLYTHDVPYEIIVVDNGSDEEPLRWLRSVGWIRVIERGDETPENWVYAMNTALDIGLQEAKGEYYLIMHSDVIVKNKQWLPTLIDKIEENDLNATAGSWKLEGRSRLGQLVKDATDTKRTRLWLRRKFLHDQNAFQLKRELCPRDYCALYKTEVLRQFNFSFVAKNGYTAGETVYYDLKRKGYKAGIIPVRQMMTLMDHIAHATGAILPNRQLNHKKKIFQTRRKINRLWKRKDINAILDTMADS